MASSMQPFESVMAPASLMGCLLANGDEYVRCSRCLFGGCDVRVEGCGCTMHVRCLELNREEPLSCCPQCKRSTTGLVLFPMSFREIDEARKIASSLASNGRRNRKRKSSEVNAAGDEKGSYVSDRRTGRWTTEEIALCDKLIEKFEMGHLPILDGIKLNDFLGNMLKSKQSRLTKKMKNAKLSSKTFERALDYTVDIDDARRFSDLEESFFHGIQCPQERAEIKFHMQKEWRDLFSNLCVSIGQPLDADAWLSSVEEMDRRATHAKESARMARRKLMMGFALRHDAKNSDNGVFIEHADDDQQAAEESAAAMILGADGADADDVLALLSDKSMLESTKPSSTANEFAGGSSLLHSAPFLSRALSYMHRHHVPFEHIDLWVPSFVPNAPEGETDGASNCRLCYAGNATVEMQVGQDGKCTLPMSAEEHFNLSAFGDYSQKFSFDVGCGLPGRVYQSGMPTWEQSVMNAPHHHFERGGGARQWGIRTVVGIPIASPSVGRIVVVLYSRHDREKDQELVGRLSDEFTKLMPSPKWKLVVDIGEPEPLLHLHSSQAISAHEVTSDANIAQVRDAEISSSFDVSHESVNEKPRDSRIDNVIALLGEFMPSDPSSPIASYLPGFMSLRLMLLRPSRAAQEEDMVRTMLGSYSSYSAGGRTKSDIAVMLARDYMFLVQQTSPQHQSIPQHQSFLGQSALSNSMTQSNASSLGYSFFGLSSANGPISNFHNSPALAPIPMSGKLHDSISIVSM